MALTITKLFAPFQLPNAVAAFYTLPASPATNVLKNGRLRLTNTTAGAVTATLHADAAANPSAAGNAFLSAVSIAANSSIEVDIPTMQAGDTLRGVASAAASITVHEMGGIIQS